MVAAGSQDAHSSSVGDKGVRGQATSVFKRNRCALPLSTVYLNMRRLVTMHDVAGVIGRALKREKDGVLEAPPECTTVVFLDDVHFAEEVCVIAKTKHKGNERIQDHLKSNIVGLPSGDGGSYREENSNET